MESERRHISVHIEKTGGVSISRFLMELYGPSRVFIYQPFSDGFVCLKNDMNLQVHTRNPVMDKAAEIAKVVFAILPYELLVTRKLLYRNEGSIPASELPKDWTAIHGHFGSDRFKGLATNPFMSIVFRDPLQRVASHFRDWKRSRGITNWSIYIPYDSNIDIKDFALLPEMQNFQSGVLGKAKLEDFDVVGVTEDLAGFIRRVVQGQGMKLKRLNLAHLNGSPRLLNLSEPGIDANFLRKFKSLNEADYENYQKAKRLSLLDPS